MACLRNTPARVLVQAVSKLQLNGFLRVTKLIRTTDHRPQPLCKYLPIVDGVNILDFPSVSLTKGHFSKWAPLTTVS